MDDDVTRVLRGHALGVLLGLALWLLAALAVAKASGRL